MPGLPLFNISLVNIFHLVIKKLLDDAISKITEAESFQVFCSLHQKTTMMEFPIQIIDKTIKSMDKQMGLIIEAGGQTSVMNTKPQDLIML